MTDTLFADVLLPLPLAKVFVYRIPRHLEGVVAERIRVVVPFGKKKRYSGLISRLHHQAPKDREARYIEDVLDIEPCIGEKHLAFWDWMANYYMCTPGEVMNAALPTALKLSSETIVRLHPEIDEEASIQGLQEREVRLLDALRQSGALNLEEAAQAAGIKTIFPLLKRLMDRKLVAADEELKDIFKPRKEVYIRLSTEYHQEERLNILLDSLNRATRQQEILIGYLSLPEGLQGGFGWVSRKALMTNFPKGASALAALVDKSVFESETRTISRLGAESLDGQSFSLSDQQTRALSEIQEGLEQGKPVLLQGATGSGKTEIYIRLMEEALERGDQVLYMLPEIALSSEIILRLRRHFGTRVQVYHSRFSEQERMEVWNAVSNFETSGQLVLGTRSSLFLPFRQLGLLIVDEEHDPSFKQQDPSPRYQSRDSAIYLAKQSGAGIVLGSATPSLESAYQARIGKYHQVILKERFGGAVLPDVLLDDLSVQTKKGRMKGSFGPLLLSEASLSFEQDKQVLLFRNRRGFAPMLECAKCKWIPHCVQCDISLTYHKSQHQLRCHYCGYALNVPSHCAECSSTDIRMKGFGTEKIEEEIQELFPGISVGRMDLDTTRSKSSYHRLMEDFREKRTQVMVGTQMISKGLDFGQVRLVGVLSADGMLNYPDFRANERGFQLLSQVAGRAGRRKEPGLAVIQTWKPDHPVLKWVQQHDYEGFYASEIDERKKYGYPPFTRLIGIYIRHEDIHQLEPAAELLGQWLRSIFGNRLLGPEFPPVAKVRNRFQKNYLLKLEQGIALQKVKEELQKQTARFFEENPLKGFRLIFDVDPYH
jgi:primosomal protein N' (replication factor Y)